MMRFPVLLWVLYARFIAAALLEEMRKWVFEKREGK
jgi:hypothetical protein